MYRTHREVGLDFTMAMMAATRKSLCNDLIRLGVRSGDLIMAHAGMRSVGRIVGGVNVLVQALFDVLGTNGTLTAYVDFEPFYEDDDDPGDIPAFDKRIAPAARDHGVLHETLRNWPGAVRSDHPDAGVVAIGPMAEWLTADHPFQYGYGPGSPFDKFVQRDGRVLMIGAPLDTITVLHYAEHLANLPDKRVHRYRRLMAREGDSVRVDFEEFDTREPVTHRLPENCFEQIAQSYLRTGCGAQGRVGEAASYLFRARPLVAYAVEWMERYVSTLDVQ